MNTTSVQADKSVSVRSTTQHDQLHMRKEEKEKFGGSGDQHRLSDSSICRAIGVFTTQAIVSAMWFEQ